MPLENESVNRIPYRTGHDRTEITTLYENDHEYVTEQFTWDGIYKVYSRPPGRKEVPVLNRLWDGTIFCPHPKLVVPCMLFFPTMDNGYAQIWYKGKYIRIHRLALLLSGQTLTKGMTVDHICERKNCWNTLHLEEVTYKVNTLRRPDREGR